MKLFTYLLTLIVILLCAGASRAEAGKLRMHVINVGQAESILIEMPNHAVLIDAAGEDTIRDTGSGAAKDFYWRQLREYLDAFFQSNAHLHNTLYAVIVSHPHKDHTKYLKFIFNRYSVQHLIEGGHSSTSTFSGIQDMADVRQIVNEKGIGHIRVKYNGVNSQQLSAWVANVEQGSGARVRFLSGRRGCNNANNDSLVIRIDYGQNSMLLTGDSQVDDIRYEDQDPGCGGQLPFLLHRFSSDLSVLDADIYKVGHHGAKNGSYREFLQAVTPKFAVMSAGHFQDQEPGEYHGWNHGHPNERTVRLLEEFATDRTNPVKVYTMKGQYQVLQDRWIRKNIYCTCWGAKAVVFTLSADGTPIKVAEIVP